MLCKDPFKARDERVERSIAACDSLQSLSQRSARCRRDSDGSVRRRVRDDCPPFERCVVTLLEERAGLQRVEVDLGSGAGARVRADAADRPRRRRRRGRREHDRGRARARHRRLARRALEPRPARLVGARPRPHHQGALHEPAGRRREHRGALARARRRRRRSTGCRWSPPRCTASCRRSRLAFKQRASRRAARVRDDRRRRAAARALRSRRADCAPATSSTRRSRAGTRSAATTKRCRCTARSRSRDHIAHADAAVVVDGAGRRRHRDPARVLRHRGRARCSTPRPGLARHPDRLPARLVRRPRAAPSRRLAPQHHRLDASRPAARVARAASPCVGGDGRGRRSRKDLATLGHRRDATRSSTSRRSASSTCSTPHGLRRRVDGPARRAPIRCCSRWPPRPVSVAADRVVRTLACTTCRTRPVASNAS